MGVESCGGAERVNPSPYPSPLTGEGAVMVWGRQQGVHRSSGVDPVSDVEGCPARSYKRDLVLSERVDRMQIRVQGPTYFSQNDEAAMFEWLGRMTFLRDVTGEGRDLLIRLKRAPTDDQLRDLLALFFRYRMDMRSLAILRTTDNESWFADQGGYWFEAVFG